MTINSVKTKRAIRLAGALIIAGGSIVACSQDDTNDAQPDQTSETADPAAQNTTVPDTAAQSPSSTQADQSSTSVEPSVDSSSIHEHFSHFEGVSTREEGEYFRVSSDGLAHHTMMEGIVSWQQQVPLPQDYTGSNSWSIPLEPVLADDPISTTDHFHRGAVAIAVNGIPMFNALNNRGEFAADVGELDDWGGHSGRADDYHYHLAPEHLEDTVGEGNPIAYALDGFPLFAQTSETLDEYLGRFDEDGAYRYHAVDYQPYYIAGFRGEVQIDPGSEAPEDQVFPQSKTTPVRGSYGPLAGAEITGLEQTAPNAYSLEYEVDGEVSSVNYSWDADGLYTFEFIDASGNSSIETYPS
ncbi:MAG: YHYH protein [Actinomycetia bacterium]|nr:YHYH protein [Actinomycetes bacterium]